MKHAMSLAVVFLLAGAPAKAGDPAWKIETSPTKAVVKISVVTDDLPSNEIVVSAVCTVSFEETDGKPGPPEQFVLKKVPIVARELVSEEFPHSHAEKAKIATSSMELKIRTLGRESLTAQ